MHFDKLLSAANSKLNRVESSAHFSSGQVSAAIETIDGNIYTGVCLDSACSLGMCAERNAIGTMVTEGEFQITKLVCVKESTGVILPCGACRELLMQVHANNFEMEVLVDEYGTTVKLKELLPLWWAKNDDS